MVKPGDAFFFAAAHSHLWVVITTPAGPEGVLLALNLTSVKDQPLDPSCVLDKGDHPFITKATEVNYRKAMDLRVEGDNGIRTNIGLLTFQQRVNAKVLRRVQEGALKSRFLKERFKDMVRTELGLPPAKR